MSTRTTAQDRFGSKREPSPWFLGRTDDSTTRNFFLAKYNIYITPGLGQVGHMSKDCISMSICHNCGGRGHMAFECRSGRFMDRYPRRY